VRVEDKATAELGEGGDTLGVTVLFTVGVGTVEDDPATDVLRVSGTFELNYRRILEGAEVTPEDAGVFARINGFYNAWPYIREIVGSFFTRMGYPPLTLASLVIATRPDEPSAENKKR
jgi:preprotein translocase subunit SecB